MTRLFDPVSAGKLTLRNRMMRSATAERMADPGTGAPLSSLREMYRELAEGGIGLIVTGHVYVARGGKAHPEMAGLHADDLIPVWRDMIRPAQQNGAKVMVQINHAGANCDPAATPHALSPSGVATNDRTTHPGAMAETDILEVAQAFGQAAQRAREAGFDGVQIHGAHGYLVCQFLTPATNLRTDRWGGDAERRRAFLRQVIDKVREQAGADYPVWIKLGVAGSEASGLTLEQGVQTAITCVERGVDAIEISNGWGMPAWVEDAPEPPFLRMADAVRSAVGPDYPLALVNGFRNLSVMQDVLESGAADMISLCRPLIVEPDLPRKLRDGLSDRASCARCSQCWPEQPGEGIACHNRSVQRRLAEAL
jgi:2,4-dienoyl-CoA reductase-like NADH-dependent reductase (Old Yellow Enzyme family)